MIVYVESNFVLELALHQEQSSHALALLEMAEIGQIDLRIPAYSLLEPYEAIIRRNNTRKDLSKKMEHEFSQILRNSRYQGQKQATDNVLTLFAQSIQESFTELRGTIERVERSSTIIPLCGKLIQNSLSLQDDRSLSPQDAVVYASVFDDVEREQASCSDFLGRFITRNKKDFRSPDIRSDLLAKNCSLFFDFAAGAAYAASQQITNNEPSLPAHQI